MKTIISLTTVISFVMGSLWIATSLSYAPQIKALKAQIQACEARPPCKRELDK